MYNLEQIANLYSTSSENARRWCIEFAPFLSEGANPPNQRKRLLSDDDLTVLSLVAEMRQQGHVFKTIHEALGEGKRGALPANPSAVVPADKSRLAKLQADVNRLSEALQVTMDGMKELRGENKALRDELEAAKEKIDRLNREIGRLEVNKGD